MICITEIVCESTTIVRRKWRNEFNVLQGQYEIFFDMRVFFYFFKDLMFTTLFF